MNSPSGNIGAAAEHTIALLCATARNIGDGCASLKASKWERSRLVGVEYKGKTLGIIGLGKGTKLLSSSWTRCQESMTDREQSVSPLLAWR